MITTKGKVYQKVLKTNSRHASSRCTHAVFSGKSNLNTHQLVYADAEAELKSEGFRDLEHYASGGVSEYGRLSRYSCYFGSTSAVRLSRFTCERMVREDSSIAVVKNALDHTLDFDTQLKRAQSRQVWSRQQQRRLLQNHSGKLISQCCITPQQYMALADNSYAQISMKSRKKNLLLLFIKQVHVALQGPEYRLLSYRVRPYIHFSFRRDRGAILRRRSDSAVVFRNTANRKAVSQHVRNKRIDYWCIFTIIKRRTLLRIVSAVYEYLYTVRSGDCLAYGKLHERNSRHRGSCRNLTPLYRGSWGYVISDLREFQSALMPIVVKV